MLKWTKTEDKLPESHPHSEPCAPYYTVKCAGYAPMQAMFLDGDWYTTYLTKIVVPVVAWLEDTGKFSQECRKKALTIQALSIHIASASKRSNTEDAMLELVDMVLALTNEVEVK